MDKHGSAVLRSILCCLLAASGALFAQSPRVNVSAIPAPQTVPDSARVTLAGSTSPLARAEYDSGAAPANLTMSRMLLLLKPASEQAQQLSEYLKQIQDPRSPNYHRWLTASQFGAAYGVTKENLQLASGWLEQQGFTVSQVSAGGQWIEFSGTVAQVEAAFNTSIHRYVPNGVQHIANATNLQIPAVLSSAVIGVVSMNDFESRAAHTTIGSSTAPGLTPAQFAAIYNVTPLYKSGIDGAGQRIALIERSNIQLTDVEAFRDRFSLPSNDPQTIVNGPDPGRNSNEPQALLDAEWAGAVAPKAALKLVASASTHATDGVDLSIAYAVDHALAPVMEVGFDSCEPNLDPYHRQFYASMWAQAAAEGISVIVAAGNNGVADCDDSSNAGNAPTGVAVNGIASTPWNTAVGGTSFASAPVETKGYVPEIGWSATDEPQAGGGGVSSIYATPDWQVAAGVPGFDPETAGQHHRYLPDVSLNAGEVAYELCFEGNCGRGEVANVSGTSASAAAFAGVMALVNEYTRSPQGNAAPVLYALSRKAQGLHDVVAGSNRMPCLPGGPGCDASSMIGYWAAPEFDLATGLGSIDATGFVQNYATASATGTGQASVTLSPATATVLSGSAFTISAIVSAVVTNSPVPTGTVTFADNVAGTLGTVNLSGGTAGFTAPATLAVGSHTITGQYSGDDNYAPATSTGISVNIVQGTAVIALTASSLTPAYGTDLTATATLHATTTVDNAQPTGTIAFTVDSTAVGTAILTAGTTSSTASLAITTPTPGNHMIGATYSGDANFGALTATPLTVAAQKGTSVTTLVANPSTLISGTPTTFTATIANAVSGVTPALGFTGNVVFYDGTLPVGNQVNVTNNQAILPNITLDPTVTHIITAQYYGDGNWGGSTSAPLTLAVALAPTVTTLTSSASIGLTGSSVTFTAVVSGASTTDPTAVPTGVVTFLDGTTAIGTGTLALNLGQVTTTFTTSNLSVGAHTITAKYAGDTNFAASISSPVTVAIGSYGVTPDTTSLTVTAGQTGNVVFTVAGGLGLPVQFSCQPPVGTDTQCSFSPTSVTGEGKTTLTITTTAATAAKSNSFAGKAGIFACLVLLFLPFGARTRRFSRRRLLLLLTLIAGMSTTGCGSSNPPTVPGTPSGVQVFTVITSVTVNNQTTTQQLYISVNVVS